MVRGQVEVDLASIIFVTCLIITSIKLKEPIRRTFLEASTVKFHMRADLAIRRLRRDLCLGWHLHLAWTSCLKRTKSEEVSIWVKKATMRSRHAKVMLARVRLIGTPKKHRVASKHWGQKEASLEPPWVPQSRNHLSIKILSNQITNKIWWTIKTIRIQ